VAVLQAQSNCLKNHVEMILQIINTLSPNKPSQDQEPKLSLRMKSKKLKRDLSLQKS
jgi:hypothetical protein